MGVEPGSVIDYKLAEAARQESKNAMAIAQVGTADAAMPWGGKTGKTGRPLASRNSENCERSKGAATLGGKK